MNLSLILTVVFNSGGLSNIILSIFYFVTIFYFGDFKINKIKLLILFSFTITIVGNAQSITEPKELIRLFILISLFMSFPMKIRTDMVNAKLLFGVMILIFIFQIGAALNIQILSEVIETYYPIENNVWESSEILDNSSIYNLAEMRFAGIYHNPNIMGQMMFILFVLYLISNVNDKKNLKSLVIISIVVLFSVYLSGSRTAFYPLVGVLLFFLVNKPSKKSTKIVGIALLISIFTLFSSRIFSFGGTSQPSSMMIKWSILSNYLSSISIDDNFSWFHFIFGNVYQGQIMFDADYGYLIYSIGFLGVGLIIYFFITVFNKIRKQDRYVYLLFAYVIGATIIYNFRFSMLFFIILSIAINLNYTSYRTKHIA